MLRSPFSADTTTGVSFTTVTTNMDATNTYVHGWCTPGDPSGTTVGEDGFFLCVHNAPLPLTTDGVYYFRTRGADERAAGLIPINGSYVHSLPSDFHFEITTARRTIG